MMNFYPRPPKLYSTFTSGEFGTKSSQSFTSSQDENNKHTGICTQTGLNLPQVDDYCEGDFVNDQSKKAGKDVFESSLELEGLLVDQAIDNFMTLPEALNEVISIQKGQGDEIHKQELVLAFVQDQIAKAKEKNMKVREEIASAERQILLVDEDRYKAERSCRETQKEIRSIVSEISVLKFNEGQIRQEVEEENREMMEYRDKMQDYTTDVQKYEDSLDLFSSLRELEQKVQDLKDQEVSVLAQNEVQRITSGEIVREQQQYLTDLQEEEAKVRESTKTTQLQIQEEKTHHAALDQSIQVLQKRNSAQLMRLKRQMKEAGCRNRRWTDQIQRLQESINQLQWKLAQ